ncbi:MAG: hypothetical protein AAF694_27225 [Bacteroidota bacterium]
MKSIHKIQNTSIFLLLLYLCLCPFGVQGQIDEEKMDRDVEIMQKALNEVLKQEFSWEPTPLWRNKNKSRYIPNVGIVLYAGNSSNSFSFGQNQSDDDEPEMLPIFIDFLADYGDLARELPLEESIMIRYTTGEGSNSFYWVEGKKGKVKTETIRSFPGKETATSLLVKAQKESVTQFRRGEINRDDFEARLEISQSEGEETTTKEFKIFGEILKSLFQQDDNGGETVFAITQSGRADEEDEPCDPVPCDEEAFRWNSYSFKSAWGDRVEHERILGLGVVYELSLGYYLAGYNSILSLARFNEDEWEEREEEGEMDEEQREYLIKRDNKLEDIYGDFLKEMKEAMVLYGRTLRSLEEKEYLMVRTELPACFECELPAKVEFKISREALSEFDTGDSDLEEVMDQVGISEEGKANELQNLKSLYFDNSNIRVINGKSGKDIRILRDRSRKRN